VEHIYKDPSKTMNIKYINLIISLESNGTCLATCPPGHFTTNGSECIRCYRGCTQCAGSPLACLACQRGFSLDSKRQVCVRDTPSDGHCDADCYECDAQVINIFICQLSQLLSVFRYNNKSERCFVEIIYCFIECDNSPNWELK